MLCYPPGVDFAKGFGGCLYASAMTIHPTCPPYPDTLATDLPRFNRKVADSGAARVILTTQKYHLATTMAKAKSVYHGTLHSSLRTEPLATR
ncbi:hypothetical protein DYB28_005191 [Aphanomyces astaci]|uniref:Uncharacterized protein n=1 Tax=Aphanomyces astaci TaxID=112090 RepID=A0A397FHH3_APHAT|nr:hypothetical protein DYB25_010960 [Aphanomyces astaci]RHY10475.1 hypothetical protein DYB36_004375 [Aphanomyces astaci]RHY66965.1 hypothetical protein DYB30_007556 [Aphanomyces astaci]RHY69402.1 hypothetical protein DYB38_008897 [Aphanomyces astaci]RHY75660.1 hypothetical protein DYB34_008521 [Aphanomyces astaci]